MKLATAFELIGQTSLCEYASCIAATDSERAETARDRYAPTLPDARLPRSDDLEGLQ